MLATRHPSRYLSKIVRRPVSEHIASSTLIILILLHTIINGPDDFVVATSFFPKTTSNTKQQQQQKNVAGDKKVVKVSSTQVNIATVQPQSMPVGFWSPQLERLFIPQNLQPKSTFEKGRKVAKDATQETSLSGWNMDFKAILQDHIIPTHVGIESVQVIAEHLTTSIVLPLWNTALNAMDDQLLSHIYNSVGKSNTATRTITVDPGDFLGEVDGWSAYFDRAGTCLIYYFHKGTGVSQWEVPYPNYPLPNLNHQQIHMMKQKLSEQQAQQQQQVVMAVKDDKSSSNISKPPMQINGMFLGIQNFWKGRGGSNKEPEKKPNEKNGENKPWWTSVTDIIFESENENKKEVVFDFENKSGKAKVVSEQLPFFATISDEKNDEWSSVSFAPKSTPSDLLQSFDALSTTLSPWWDMLREGVVKAAAATLESQSATVDEVSVESQPARQQKQLWDYFFPVNVEEKERIYSQSTIVVKPTIKGQSPLEPTLEGIDDGTNNNLVGWMSDLPLFLTRDVSRTVPLFGLFPKKSNDVNDDKSLIVSASVPLKGTSLLNKEKQLSHDERMKLLEEKRYAASLARQANLRKAYGTMTHDRSPTVSLTSIKLQKSKLSNQNIDWYKNI